MAKSERERKISICNRTLYAVNALPHGAHRGLFFGGTKSSETDPPSPSGSDKNSATTPTTATSTASASTATKAGKVTQRMVEEDEICDTAEADLISIWALDRRQFSFLCLKDLIQPEVHQLKGSELVVPVELSRPNQYPQKTINCNPFQFSVSGVPKFLTIKSLSASIGLPFREFVTRRER